MPLGAIFLGLIVGALVASNSTFVAWIRNREKKMEDLFPRIDPIVVIWNARLTSAPERGLTWLGDRSKAAIVSLAGGAQAFDRRLFSEKIGRGFSDYTSSLSLLIRFVHSGNMRAYIFIGALITLLSGFLFLLGGA